MSCVFYLCTICGHNQLVDGLCPKCNVPLSVEWDEWRDGHPDGDQSDPDPSDDDEDQPPDDD